MAKRKRSSLGGLGNYLGQAQALADVQYGPQFSSLASALQDVASELKQGTQFERGAAQGIQAALKAARPVVQQDFADLTKNAKLAQQNYSQTMAGLGSSADPFRAAAARESLGAGSVDRAQERTLRDLTMRGAEAQAGAVYNTRNLQNRARQERSKLRTQAKDLTRQQASFVAGEVPKLANQDFDRQIDLANLDLRAQEVNAKKRGGGLSPSEQRQRAERSASAKDEIERAQGLVADLMKGGEKSVRIRQLLKVGGILDDGTEVKPVPNDYITAAFERHNLKGKLTPGTVKALRRRRVSVPGTWLPPELRKRRPARTGPTKTRKGVPYYGQG